jgi:hypothetical protein
MSGIYGSDAPVGRFAKPMTTWAVGDAPFNLDASNVSFACTHLGSARVRSASVEFDGGDQAG